MSTIDGHNTQSQYGVGQAYGQPQYAPVQAYARSQGYPPVPVHSGPVGKVRGTWAVIGLSITTFGIYSLGYYFSVHEEMKRHSGEGVGGAVGLVTSLFTFGLVTPFLLPTRSATSTPGRAARARSPRRRACGFSWAGSS